MSVQIDLLAGADDDLQEIFNVLEEYRDGFGTEFLTAIEAYLVRISNFPESAPVYFEKVRRQIVRRSPYGIFYEPNPTRIVVIAILDLRQDATQILRRLRH